MPFIKKIDHLDIEVTQRCNLDCPHCLRGEPRNKDMSLETLKRLSVILKDVEINQIQLMGGEPTLNPDIVYHIYDLFDYNGICLISNGHTFSQNFCDAFVKCLSKVKNKSYIDSCFQVSRDPYHIKIQGGKDRDLYKKFFKDNVSPNLYYSRKHSFKPENRGKLQHSHKQELYWESYTDDIQILKYGNALHIDTLYVTVDGDYTLSCNHSFKFNENHNFGNIYRDNIHDICNVKDYICQTYFNGNIQKATDYFDDELHRIIISKTIQFVDYEGNSLLCR